MPVDATVLRLVRQAPNPVPRKLIPFLRYILFHIYFVPTSLALLPLYILRSLIPQLRKDVRWSFLQNLSVLYVRRVIRVYSRLKVQPIQPREDGWRENNSTLGTFLEFVNMSGPGGRVIHPVESLQAAEQATGKRSDRVWIAPPPLEAFRGILTVNTGGPGAGFAHGSTYTGPPLVRPSFAKVRTRCFWFMHRDQLSPPQPTEPKKRDRNVILYFHGGAGVTFGAGDLFMGQTLARNLAHTTGIDVFSVDYLLSPVAKWPEHIVQALAGWFYLTRELGYHPSQIIIGGDSFGGGLTLQLTRYLLLDLPGHDGSDAPRKGGERPAALLLLSPMTDGRCIDEAFKPPCYDRNHSRDIIAMSYGVWGFDAAGMSATSKKNMKRSPILTNHDPWFAQVLLSSEELAMYPPMYVMNGGNEVLLDMGHEFVRRARNAGVKPVAHDVVDTGVHDYWTLHTFLPEAKDSYTRFKKWLDENHITSRAQSHL